MLDKEPNADGISLPTNTKVIGLINQKKPDCYQGSDFYSRFDLTECCPIDADLLKTSPTQRVINIIEPTRQKVETHVIDLFHATDWKEKLLGRWELNGQTLTFMEGALVQAISSEKPIEIQHGFWGDKQFERFWQQLLTRGVRHGNKFIRLDEKVQLLRPKVDSYTWEKVPELNTTFPSTGSTPGHILNPTGLMHFLGPYDVVGNKLIKQKGLIEANKNGRLVVDVTRSLSDDVWAMLLAECATHNVTLEVHYAPGVTLPEAFAASAAPVKVPTVNPGLPQTLTQDVFIHSTDIDTSVKILQNTYPTSIIIDVSECTVADLLEKIDGKLQNGQSNEDAPTFEFIKTSSALTDALGQNKHPIILKGQFSPEVLDALAPVMQKLPPRENSKMMLVTDDNSAGQYIMQRYTHQVTLEEKLSCLPPDEGVRNKLAPYIANESLSQLEARATYLTINPDAHDSDAAWLGMQHIAETKAVFTPLDKTNSMGQTTEFTLQRVAQVNGVLEHSPYVFLTGLSGVGKTTFVERELKKHSDTLYLTEEKIEAWAQDSSTNRKILFIDEANLSSRQWSEFEGLFNKPPRILVKGKLYNLTPEHKVIFAGNPVSYGDERKLAAFFQRHGNAVLFTPLPPAVIYEKILKPICHGMPDDQVDIMAKKILSVYEFVCQCSSTEILITPRELQMMALLAMRHQALNPAKLMQEIIDSFSYDLAKNLVPPSSRTSFEKQFKPSVTNAQANREWQSSSFMITPSRDEITDKLDDMLELREWRSANINGLNKEQRSGGLGGIIIEGEPGIGKSELVVNNLIMRGYEEVRDLNQAIEKQKFFYRMSVTMPTSEKEKLLIKAFNEGAVVVVDEINSSPMMERLLNDLLMGNNPKAKDGETAPKPGFMLIGTQNPCTMAGRRVASTALSRRLISVALPEYPSAEIISILLSKGIAASTAENMLQAYEERRTFAKINQCSPIPNFRDLMKLADAVLRGKPVLETNPVLNETKCASGEAGLTSTVVSEAAIDLDKKESILSFKYSDCSSERPSNDIGDIFYKTSPEAHETNPNISGAFNHEEQLKIKTALTKSIQSISIFGGPNKASKVSALNSIKTDIESKLKLTHDKAEITDLLKQFAGKTREYRFIKKTTTSFKIFKKEIQSILPPDQCKYEENLKKFTPCKGNKNN